MNEQRMPQTAAPKQTCAEELLIAVGETRNIANSTMEVLASKLAPYGMPMPEETACDQLDTPRPDFFSQAMADIRGIQSRLGKMMRLIENCEL